MTYYFDGKSFSEKKKKLLKHRVTKLVKQGVKPKLVSILVGDDLASKLYLRLKREAAQQVGCELDVISFKSSVKVEIIVEKINQLNHDGSVHGVMVQLPFPTGYSVLDRDKVINSIDLNKDIDGLGKGGQFLTPVVLAVFEVLRDAADRLSLRKGLSVVVVGHRGFEGKKIVSALKKRGYKVIGVDKDTLDFKGVLLLADVIVSATGHTGLVKKNMVRKDAVLIDVGSPKGDIEKPAYDRAAYVSPVPGGIGPMTIAFLLENLYHSAFGFVENQGKG